jgi:hypothetical protein
MAEAVRLESGKFPYHPVQLALVRFVAARAPLRVRAQRTSIRSHPLSSFQRPTGDGVAPVDKATEDTSFSLRVKVVSRGGGI